MVKQRIFIVLALFHFGVIILYNILSTSYGYQEIYGKASPNQERHSLISKMKALSHLSSITQYAQFSGAETGYGFFAPQVGSQYISTFEFYDEKGKLLSRTNAPGLEKNESFIRYSSYLDLYQDMLLAEGNKTASDVLDIRYAKAILYSMAERLIKKNPEAKSIKASIHLYKTPLLKNYSREQDVQFIPIHEITLAKGL